MPEFYIIAHKNIFLEYFLGWRHAPPSPTPTSAMFNIYIVNTSLNMNLTLYQSIYLMMR